MPFAFVRIEEVITPQGRLRRRPALIVDWDAIEAVGLQGIIAMFGAMRKGWGLCFTDYPLQYFSETDPADYFLLTEIGALGQPVKDLSPARRQAMNAWLTNRGYDTSWIGPNTTIKEVLKDIIHHLNDRLGIADNLVKWCQEYMSD